MEVAGGKGSMLSSDKSPVQGAREQSSETARASLASCTFIWSTYQ